MRTNPIVTADGPEKIGRLNRLRAERLHHLEGLPPRGPGFTAEHQARAALYDLPVEPVDLPEVDRRDDAAPGPHGDVPVRVYTPRALAAPDAHGRRGAVVWIHGGAFIFGDLDMPEADHTAARLAHATPPDEPLAQHLSHALSDDTQAPEQVLFRFLHLIDEHQTTWPTALSPNGRISALHEAVCTLRRAGNEHPVLLLLGAFCLFYLGTEGNAVLEDDLSKTYEEGLVGLYRLMPDFAHFREQLEAYNRFVRNETDAADAAEELMARSESRLMLIRAADILQNHLAYTKALLDKWLSPIN